MIAIGFQYWDGNKRTDTCLVGKGDRNHVDKLLARAPEGYRKSIAGFLKPLVEGEKPKHGGMYSAIDGKPDSDHIVWWKNAELV